MVRYIFIFLHFEYIFFYFLFFIELIAQEEITRQGLNILSEKKKYI